MPCHLWQGFFYLNPLTVKNITYIPEFDKEKLISRNNLLDEIDEKICKPTENLVIVGGSPGIGKTTLALSYIDFMANTKNYEMVAWISPSGKTIRENFISAFLQAGNFPGFNHKSSPDNNFKILIKQIKKDKCKKLIIVDNLNNIDDIEELYDYFYDTNCKIIVTSNLWNERYSSIFVTPFELHKAYKLFISYNDNIHDTEQINNLLKKIDYHTLLTILTAKILKHNQKITIKKLLKLFDSKAVQKYNAVKLNEDRARKYEIYTAILLQALSFDKDKKYYLTFLSILPAGREYTEDFLVDLFFIRPEKRETFTNDISELNKYGWILDSKNKFGNQHFFVHRLIRLAIKNIIQPDLDDYRSTIWRLALKLSFADQKINRLTEKLLWSEISESAISYFDNPGMIKKNDGADNLALLYNNLALCYQDLSQYEKAIEYQSRALNIYNYIHDKPNISIAKSYNNLSSIYRDLGNLEEALKNQRQTIEIKEKILENDNPSLARSYNNMSLIYSDMKEYEKAIYYQTKAIQIRETFEKSPNPELANSFHNLSSIYSHTGDIQSAVNYQTKAIKLYQEIYKIPHPTMATAYSNLSLLYKKLGNIDEALDAQLLALDIRKVTLNHAHIDMENSYSNLAIIYLDMKKYNKALENAELSIKILERLFPNGHARLDNANNIKNQIIENLKMMN